MNESSKERLSGAVNALFQLNDSHINTLQIPACLWLALRCHH